MKIGFIGLGNMGQGMADNLLQKGADLMVFTRSVEKISAMKKKGAKGASSLEEISKETEIIFICLPDIETSIQIVKEKIIRNKICSEKKLEKINNDTIKKVKEAAEYALNSPHPKHDDLYQDVYI